MPFLHHQNEPVPNACSIYVDFFVKDFHQFQTNVLAVAICAREAVKIMQESNTDDGHIINIGR